MPDSLATKIDELRAERPREFSREAMRDWLAQLAPVVQTMPTIERRLACVILIANDIVLAHPERCLRDIFWVIAWALLETEEVEQLQADREAGNRARPEWIEPIGST